MDLFYFYIAQVERAVLCKIFGRKPKIFKNFLNVAHPKRKKIRFSIL